MVQFLEQIQKALVLLKASHNVYVVSHCVADFDLCSAEKAPVAAFKVRPKTGQPSKRSTLFLLSSSGRWYYPSMSLIILVRGSGDVGSAVAHTLFKADYTVVIHDSAQPSATRRRMSFCDAIFDGNAALDGVSAQLYEDISELITRLTAHDLVPLTTLDLPRILAALRPEVLVDAE